MSVDSSSTGSWNDFIELCLDIGSVSSRLGKTDIMKKFVADYNGDLKVLLQLLLPKTTHRVYQMNRKRIIKLFSSILGHSESILNDLMTTGNKAGFLGKVISYCFEISSEHLPIKNKNTILSMNDVNNYLNELTSLTTESSQTKILTKITKKCNKRDLKWFIRQLDKDIRIDAGTKTILDGIDKSAYDTYQIKANLDYICNKIALGQALSISADLMNPIKPMLATACKSYKMAFDKCKSGVIFAEIKYDGERVQIHWDGKTWKFYSRSLKAVMPGKISDVKDDVPLSCPNGKTLILDSEILMVDKLTGKPLPFTSLGKHKRLTFSNSCPCLFVFDILYFNGESLINEPLEKRRKILEKNFKPIKNKIHLSELKIIRTESDLKDLMYKMISDNQEGLVLKDSQGVYAPNRRHWLKMKKDYLAAGVMADSADLIVLGAYKGHGRHGGLYSTFLTGCLDKSTSTFKTVCKAHNGLSDEQIENYTSSLSMIDFDRNNIPQWLDVHTSLYPDWIVRNPKKSPIFEVSGFEFSASKVHSATDHNNNGFSIRFPRITKIRDDKKYKDATSLQEIRILIKTSRENPEKILDRVNNNNNNNNNKNVKKNTKKRKKMDDDDDDQDDDNDVKMNNNNNNDNDNEPPHKKRKLNLNLKVQIPNNNNNVNKSPSPHQPPSSPVIMADTRSVCKYDATCYRKNPDHLEEYSHPVREQNEMNKIKESASSNILVIKKRLNDIENAANINKEKKIQKAKDEIEQINNEYNNIIKKAKQDYDNKVIPIKQTEAFELEKIQKKYHPK